MKWNPRAILLFIWTLLFLNLRPSLLGQTYNAPIFFLFVLVSCFVLFWENGKISFRYNRAEAKVLLCVFGLFFYLLVQGLVLSTATKTVINSAVVMSGSALCLFFVLRDLYNKTQMVKYMINIHFYLSISQIVTFMIFFYVGFKYNELPIIANFQKIAKYYYGIDNSLIHNLVFPFTITWSSFDLGNISFYRTCGIYREPGMAQLFYLTTFFLTFFYHEKNIYAKRIVILIGSILILSVSGFINLIIGLFVYVLFNKLKTIRITSSGIAKGIAVVIAVFLFSIVTYGLVQHKFKIDSGAERLENILRSFERFKLHPIFGEGYYNGFKTDEEGIVVSDKFFSFFGVLNQIGLIGVFAYMACWIVGLKNFANRRSWCIYIPCLLTLLTSQPSYNDVFTWFLLLFDTSKFYSIDS